MTTRHRSPTRRSAVTLAAALVTYGSVTNLRPSRESTYLLRNAVCAALLVTVAHRAGLSRRDLGLHPEDLTLGLRLTARVATAVAVGAALVDLAGRNSEHVRRVLADRRADVPPRQLAYQTLVRIPLGTAAFEELAFRGVLDAIATRALPGPAAVALQSAAFGLWHVAPTRLTLDRNAVTDPSLRRRAVAGATVVTGLAGLGFTALRRRSGSLLAPGAVHATLNAGALLAAAAAHRRGRRDQPGGAGRAPR